jgi:hypothetical protein
VLKNDVLLAPKVGLTKHACTSVIRLSALAALQERALPVGGRFGRWQVNRATA